MLSVVHAGTGTHHRITANSGKMLVNGREYVRATTLRNLLVSLAKVEPTGVGGWPVRLNRAVYPGKEAPPPIPSMPTLILETAPPPTRQSQSGTGAGMVALKAQSAGDDLLGAGVKGEYPDWLHHSMPNREASSLLTSCSDGTYILRRRNDTKNDEFVLSVVHCRKPTHHLLTVSSPPTEQSLKPLFLALQIRLSHLQILSLDL